MCRGVPGRFGDFMYTGPYKETYGLSVRVPSKLIGEYERYQPIYRFSETSCVTGKAPDVGEHTRDILNELGFSTETVQDLLAMRAVAFPGKDEQTPS